jgi:hypothetical protein
MVLRLSALRLVAHDTAQLCRVGYEVMAATPIDQSLDAGVFEFVVVIAA